MDKEIKKKTDVIDETTKKEEGKLDKVITVANKLKKQRRHLSEVEKKIINSHLEEDPEVNTKLTIVQGNINNATHKVENIVGGGVEELSEKQKHLVSGATEQRRQNFSGNNKRTRTHIKESKKDTEIRENNVSFFVKLYDDEDNPLDGMEIEYKIDNKDAKISDKTDHDGLSVVLFSRKPGVKTYNIKATFRGDDNYEGCVYDGKLDLAKELKLKQETTRGGKQKQLKHPDDSPNSPIDKRAEIMARLKEIEAEVQQTVKEISEYEKQ